MLLRAWLILADVLVILLLFVSLVLSYLAPKVVVSQVVLPLEEPYRLPEFSSLPALEYNDTITLQDLIAMGQTLNPQEYVIESTFLTRTLEDALTTLSAKVGDPIFIRIFKEESILEIWIRSDTEYKHLKDYAICAYSGKLGPKLKEGDKQSPEGFYRVHKHQLNPHSKFHLSFNLGYPNKYDRAYKRTGSFLMVHGNCVSVGCYAMTNVKIEEIYKLVKTALNKGQKYVQVHAYPFRMTKENMAFFSENEWHDFWVNLKEGYDYFEDQKLPPFIQVKDKQYTIHESNEL